MKSKLLTIEEAADYLGVSRPTFQKIREAHHIPVVKIGVRDRFRLEDLETILSKGSPDSIPSLAPQATFKKLRFDLFSNLKIHSIEVRENVFDLRMIQFLDPYGVMSLLTTIIVKSQKKQVQLLIDDNYICQYLKRINFFIELEKVCGDKVVWDQNILSRQVLLDPDLLLPLVAIRYKGGERSVAENLIQILKKQGFSDRIGGYIAWMLGELADNSLTHSHVALGDRICFLLANRFLIGESDCITIGIADTGVGIHQTLKSNATYSKLSDQRSVLEAFKSSVSSWDEALGRGKGLTDIVKIAMGNRSYFRVASGRYGFFMDFREKEKPTIKKINPLTNVSGTRYGLVLIDSQFEDISRSVVDTMIKKEIERLNL